MGEFKSSQEWRQYYEINASRLINIPWHLGTELSAVMRWMSYENI